jgi:DUF305 family protein family protein
MLAVAAAVSLAACGSPATHNSADVAFAQGMVPHHEQALDMTELVASRTENTRVIDLASRISRSQQPEIDRMNGWLRTWNAPVQASSHTSHGHSESHGMVDLGNLADLDGAEFDRPVALADDPAPPRRRGDGAQTPVHRHGSGDPQARPGGHHPAGEGDRGNGVASPPGLM